VEHIHLLMLYIAGCEGLTVVALYFFYSISRPSVLLAKFLRFQVSLLAICILNILYSYTIVDLGTYAILQELYFILSMGVASIFLFTMGTLTLEVAGKVATSLQSRIYAFFCAALGLVFLFPFFIHQDIETILYWQRWMDCYIVTLIMGIAIIIYPAYILWRRRKSGNRLVRTTVVLVLIINIILTSIYIITVVVVPLPGLDQEGFYLIATDNFFLSWNTIALVFFFRCVPRTVEKKDTLKVSRSSGRTVWQDWKTIDAAMVEKKLYTRPGLDLPYISRITNIPRNRISQSIAVKTGKSFNEYLNSLRLEEFDRIIAARDYSGTVLEAAFGSGFNSKSAFYAAIKKHRNTKPDEYILGTV
jgi:AraC-like DNA-binding protein